MHTRTHSQAHARTHARTHAPPARARGGRRPDLPVLILERVARAHGLRASIHSSIHCGIYWVPATRQARGKLWG